MVRSIGHMSDIDELRREMAFDKYQLSLLGASRQRMMRRTVLASLERDAYRAIALIHAPLEAAEVEAELRILTEAKGLSYTQRGPE